MKEYLRYIEEVRRNERVVLDIEEKHAILLNQDGTFVRVENKEYEIGQSVEFRPRTMRFRYGLVACIALFVIVFGLVPCIF